MSMTTLIPNGILLRLGYTFPRQSAASSATLSVTIGSPTLNKVYVVLRSGITDALDVDPLNAVA
jgi:hypothetical protein